MSMVSEGSRTVDWALTFENQYKDLLIFHIIRLPLANSASTEAEAALASL